VTNLSAPPETLSKGEKTRLNILQAALRVIAQSGYHDASHRAIAKDAGVSLSLTTYYFKDLQDLLLEAFRLHKAQLHQELQPVMKLLMSEASQVAECRSHEEDNLRGLIVDTLCEHVAKQVKNRSQGLVVEMVFYFDVHLPEHFREVAFELRQRFIDDIAEVCRAMGSEDADSDAELITGSVQRLQYEALSVPGYTGPEKIRCQLKRLLSALWL
jgi:DNA-binding transcriptional regulator YbjK